MVLAADSLEFVTGVSFVVARVVYFNAILENWNKNKIATMVMDIVIKLVLEIVTITPPDTVC